MKGSALGLVAQCPTLCHPVDWSPPVPSVHGILQARILEWDARPSPGDLPNPRMEPRSPTLQVDSSPSEPPAKPQNTGVFLFQGKSLSLFQGNFLTQESREVGPWRAVGSGGAGPDSVLRCALWWLLRGGEPEGMRAEPGTWMEGTALDQAGQDGGRGKEWDLGGAAGRGPADAAGAPGCHAFLRRQVPLAGFPLPPARHLRAPTRTCRERSLRIPVPTGKLSNWALALTAGGAPGSGH